ncbi:low temperature requirement protein A [Micromonospora costi]|uniref:Low temperature requirement protein A n=1 Tax=Micromonospora costi TaxID=1530042 RepID=A0A3B0AAA2_9ACTN|nr:low temperature requirement protein A [Micromonospora costi]RKN57463.1 low temperature requirement protein A [Micromonospora costi]
MGDPGAAGPDRLTPPLRPGLRPVEERTRVTTAELFFDVVFVFAFIQVTTLMASEASALGVLHGLLVLTMLWWTWSLFAWLGNRVRGSYGLSRLVLLVTTPVMFVLAVNTREAFNDFPGGGHATPVVFVATFFVVRLLYLALRLYASDPLRGRDVAALLAPALLATLLLLFSALLPGSGLDGTTVRYGQVALWVLAIAVEYGAALLLPVPERAVFSAGHWTERHSLIVIVALGEVLVAVGIAGADLPNSRGLIFTSALAVVVAGALEWIYFDISALVGEHALRRAEPRHWVTLARDAYSYLHLPMIAGIILLAAGLKHTPALVTTAPSYRSGAPLDDLGRYTMYGGVALYLLAHAAFQVRLSRLVLPVVWPRLLAAAVLLALLPVTARISASRSVAWLAVVCVVAAVTETVVGRNHRRRLRAAVTAE